MPRFQETSTVHRIVFAKYDRYLLYCIATITANLPYILSTEKDCATSTTLIIRPDKITHIAHIEVSITPDGGNEEAIE